MRKTEIFVVPTDGRDKGKRFLITEMPAMKAERWAYRALLALAHSGADLGEGALAGGMGAVAQAGFRALQKLNFEDARPLLDEMWDCVQVIPDPKNPEFLRPLVMNEMEGDDIEELETLWMIRERVFRLHTDFFTRGRT